MGQPQAEARRGLGAGLELAGATVGAAAGSSTALAAPGRSEKDNEANGPAAAHGDPSSAPPSASTSSASLIDASAAARLVADTDSSIDFAAPAAAASHASPSDDPARAAGPDRKLPHSFDTDAAASAVADVTFDDAAFDDATTSAFAFARPDDAALRASL